MMYLRLYSFITLLVVYYVDSTPDDSFETVHTSNAAIFNRLGLTPIEIPEGHHKKRVAGPEPPRLSSLQSRIHQPYSRRHGHRDSHVYVVKLPASQPYYTVTKPHKSMSKDDKISTRNEGSSVGDRGVVASNSVVHQSPSVGFQSNGKPAKIYHWNLPVMKKITEKKRLHAQLRLEQMRKEFNNDPKMIDKQQIHHFYPSKNILKNKYNNDKNNNIKHLLNTNNVYAHDDKSNAFKHVRNNDKLLNYPESREDFRRINFIPDNLKKVNDSRKMYRLDSPLYKIESRPNNHMPSWTLFTDLNRNNNNNMEKAKKHKKKAAMSYYAPINTKTGSNNIHKNFHGNGKPKAFYVMEKSRKPAYYHPLLP
ncbi:uncharacterized protein [Chelonus insularis]|uniref:uncharacterized protein n=1 Tax=Chelonus insularis TaxID=460826 RepID=UPI00158D7932|nr:uncharacterized protein LOC118065797 [Chelonus insularis]